MTKLEYGLHNEEKVSLFPLDNGFILYAYVKTNCYVNELDFYRMLIPFNVGFVTDNKVISCVQMSLNSYIVCLSKKDSKAVVHIFDNQLHSIDKYDIAFMVSNAINKIIPLG